MCEVCKTNITAGAGRCPACSPKSKTVEAIDCPYCKGYGFKNGNYCYQCEGIGRILSVCRDDLSPGTKVECPRCGQETYVEDIECNMCPDCVRKDMEEYEAEANDTTGIFEKINRFIENDKILNTDDRNKYWLYCLK